jgi:diaminohydroxyphosphoribosylaminopyrimidine deaminase/5-amino-6-(5-phosphoribosylamino)uracil reductase
LRTAGIDVVTGLGDAGARRDLAPYLHHRRTGRAFVTAKIATTLDGRVAAADGSSRWITSEPARADAHELRADAQAILVGAGTALADRPALTVRDVEVMPHRPPLRVLLDARGSVPAEGPLFDPALAPTLVVTTDHARAGAIDAWRSAGAKVETVAPSSSGSGVDLHAALMLLGSQGVLHAVVEGGATLLAALVTGGHAQRLVAYVAPALLGTEGVPAFAFPGPASVEGALRFEIVDVTRLGRDVRLEYEVAA